MNQIPLVERIRTERCRRDCTQEEPAGRLGVTKAAVSKWECGHMPFGLLAAGRRHRCGFAQSTWMSFARAGSAVFLLVCDAAGCCGRVRVSLGDVTEQCLLS